MRATAAGHMRAASVLAMVVYTAATNMDAARDYSTIKAKTFAGIDWKETFKDQASVDFKLDSQHGLHYGTRGSTPWGLLQHVYFKVPAGSQSVVIQHTGFYDKPSRGLGKMIVQEMPSASTLLVFSDAHSGASSGQSLAVQGKCTFTKETKDVVDRTDVLPIKAGASHVRVSMAGYTTKYPYTTRYIKRITWRSAKATTSTTVTTTTTTVTAARLTGYEMHAGNRGCIGRDELGSEELATVNGCAEKCSANSQCMSFKHDKPPAQTCRLSSSCASVAMTGCARENQMQQAMDALGVGTFSTRAQMVGAGWMFSSTESNMHRADNTAMEERYCNKVAKTAYCGCVSGSSAGSISFAMTTQAPAGIVTVTFGSVTGWTSVYINDAMVAKTSQRSEVKSFNFRSGDVLKLSEVGSSVMVLYSISFKCGGPTDEFWYLKIYPKVQGYTQHARHSGCIGRDELGAKELATAKECAARCSATNLCVSFKYDKPPGKSCKLSSTCASASMACTAQEQMSFLGRRAMQAAGWVFSSTDANMFRTESPAMEKRYCYEVPKASYCGFVSSNPVGSIRLTMTTQAPTGIVTVVFGAVVGTTSVYINDAKVATTTKLREAKSFSFR